jgi:hypothetical protein
MSAEIPDGSAGRDRGLEELAALLEAADDAAARALLAELHPADVAEALNRARPPEVRRQVFALLDTDRGDSSQPDRPDGPGRDPRHPVRRRVAGNCRGAGFG